MRALLLALAAAVLFTACSDGEGTPSPEASAPAPPGDPAPLNLAALEGATVTTELTPDGVTLRGGRFSQPAAPGSASLIEVMLDQHVLGDIDGDGVDAAAIIVSSGGGSGTFYELAVFLATEAGPRQAGSTPLGDRVQVTGVHLALGAATAEYLTRPDGAPFSDAPTVVASARVTVD